jgi:hypothetical protein
MMGGIEMTRMVSFLGISLKRAKTFSSQDLWTFIYKVYTLHASVCMYVGDPHYIHSLANALRPSGDYSRVIFKVSLTRNYHFFKFGVIPVIFEIAFILISS